MLSHTYLVMIWVINGSSLIRNEMPFSFTFSHNKKEKERYTLIIIYEIIQFPRPRKDKWLRFFFSMI